MPQGRVLNWFFCWRWCRLLGGAAGWTLPKEITPFRRMSPFEDIGTVVVVVVWLVVRNETRALERSS